MDKIAGGYPWESSVNTILTTYTNVPTRIAGSLSTPILKVDGAIADYLKKANVTYESNIFSRDEWTVDGKPSRRVLHSAKLGSWINRDVNPTHGRRVPASNVLFSASTPQSTISIIKLFSQKKRSLQNMKASFNRSLRESDPSLKIENLLS